MALFYLSICTYRYCPYIGTMKGKVRKDVDLNPKTIKRLQKMADNDRRKLKPYMEKVLDNHADEKQ